MRSENEGSRDQNLRPWFVYTLHDPFEPEVVRYVGWTTDPKRRLKTHLRDARTGRDQTHCGNWKRSVFALGVSPVMTIVESGTGGGYGEAEMRWVAHYRSIVGKKLTNLTEGGDGTLGRVNSPEHRACISAYRKGRKATPEARENMRAAHLGMGHTPEQTAKIAAANQGRKMSQEERAQRSGRKRSPEAVEKTAAAKRGQKRSPESRAKMREAHLGKPLSPEHAKNAAESRRGLKTSPETKAKISASLKEYYARKLLAV
jgi:hypothetical protein